jgi:hypothetical protein
MRSSCRMADAPLGCAGTLTAHTPPCHPPQLRLLRDVSGEQFAEAINKTLLPRMQLAGVGRMRGWRAGLRCAWAAVGSKQEWPVTCRRVSRQATLPLWTSSTPTSPAQTSKAAPRCVACVRLPHKLRRCVERSLRILRTSSLPSGALALVLGWRARGTSCQGALHGMFMCTRHSLGFLYDA